MDKADNHIDPRLRGLTEEAHAPVRELSETLAIIHQMSRVVSSIDDPEKVLLGLVELVTRVLHVGNCSIMLIDPDTNTLRIRAAHGLEPEVIAKYRGKVGEGIAGWVAQHGKPLLIKDVTQHPLFRGQPRERYRTRSLLSVPLLTPAVAKSPAQLIGVINVNNKQNDEVFDEDDLLLLSTVAQFVAIALERARLQEIARESERLEQELHTARRIQEAILPSTLNIHGLLDVAACNLPARSVAGDFYDLVKIRDDFLCVVVGDVCGKGLPAAFYMARVVSYFRAMAFYHASPDTLTKAVNNLLAEESSDHTFVTATVTTVNPTTGEGAACVAGHFPALKRAAKNGTVAALSTENGFPLGVSRDGDFDLYHFQLEPGDLLLLYTDGVTEVADRRGELFGLERLTRLLQEHEGHAGALVERIVSAARAFSDNQPLHDDLTVIALRRRP